MVNTMRRIRVAQIGIGHDHSSAAFQSMLRQNDIYELTGFCVCEGEEDQFAKRKEEFVGAPRLTAEEILNDSSLDAVVIECNEVILTKYALLALERGFHVYMDKPGSENSEDFERMINLAKDTERVLLLGYMYRYNPAVISAMKKIKNGELGKIYSVEAHMDCLHNAQKRQWMGTFRGGMMFFLGCHLIDLIVQIQGVPEEIIPLNMTTGFDGVTGNDYGMAVFKYPNGISFAKTCAAEPGGFRRRQLVICGEKGTIEIKPFEKYIGAAGSDQNQVTGVVECYAEDCWKNGWNYTGDYYESEPFNRYDAMMADFAAAVRGDKANDYSYEYELQLHRILLAACGFDIDYKK